MEPMANMALRAARRAAQIILRSMDRLEQIEVELKARRDLVSHVDRDAESAIVDTLHKTYPDHAIQGEESGLVHGTKDAEFTWIIDPLDGTTNFLRGIPHFAVSVGVRRGKRMEHGVIIDPVRNEEFVASRGKGANLNGKRIRVTKATKLEEAMVLTGIPPGAIPDHLDTYMAMLKDITEQAFGVRRNGSAALDLAYVAAGRAEGFFEMQLQPWDIAAGSLIVREAGGLVADFEGAEGFMESGNILAANPKCFKLLLQQIHRHHSPTNTPARFTR